MAKLFLSLLLICACLVAKRQHHVVDNDKGKVFYVHPIFTVGNQDSSILSDGQKMKLKIQKILTD